ncbi:MAG: hypothetical protein HY057_01110 [Rhodospirillales bacterium]|nr:hypothetical protein [Rhodospirillales bacterium]
MALAAKGTVESHPLTFSVETVKRVSDEALGGYMPASYPLVTFMRDRPVPPPDARILAVDSAGRPACFQIGVNCLGFTGHPGIKPGIIEDLIMEFDDSPVDAAGHDIEIGPILTQLRALQKDIADALIPIMTGVIQLTGLMQPFSEAEMKRRAIIPIQR